MSNREKTIAEIPFNSKSGDNVIKVYIKYTIGRTSISTGNSQPRGYRLFVQPCNISGNCTSFRAFSCISEHILDAKKFSRATLMKINPPQVLLDKMLSIIKEREAA
jgi:hypothetical protein